MFNQPVNQNNIFDVLTNWQKDPEKSHLFKDDSFVKSTKNKSHVSVDSKSPLIVNGKISKLTASDITHLMQQRLNHSDELSMASIQTGLKILNDFKERIQEKRNNSFMERLTGPLKAKIENCRKNRGWMDSITYINQTEKLLEENLKKNDGYIDTINQYLIDENMTVRIDRPNFKRSLAFNSAKTGISPLLEKTLSLLNDPKLNEIIDIKNPKYLNRAPSQLNVSQELKVSGEFFEEIHRTLSIQLNDQILYSDSVQEENKEDSLLEAILPASKSIEQKKFDLIDTLTQKIGPIALQRLSTLMTQAGVTDFHQEISSILIKLIPPGMFALSLSHSLPNNPDEEGAVLTISYDDKSDPHQISLTAEQTFAIKKINNRGLIEPIGYISYYRKYSAPANEWSAPFSDEITIPNLRVTEVFSKVRPTIDLAKQDIKDEIELFTPLNSPRANLSRAPSLNPSHFNATFSPAPSSPTLDIREQKDYN